MKYVIQEDSGGFRPYGGAAKAFYSKDREVMLAGPAETGKTYSVLQKLHLIASGFPGVQLLIVRKSYKSAVSSVLQTYWSKVVRGEESGIERFGGMRPERFIYPNGSVIWCGGMDNAEKVLSAEYDIGYVNQAEELDLNEWEILLTRCTGRSGNMPWAQLIGDCNPSTPHHWIKHRPSLKFFESRHVDNPTLYNPLTGALTPQGEITMEILNSLTGVRRDRLLKGLWVQVEGIVYEDWDTATHLLEPSKVPRNFDKITAAIDWGYTRPGVLGVWGHDNDGRMYLLRQVFKTKRTSSWWTKQVVKANKWVHDQYGQWLSVIPCDPAEPDYIADLNSATNRDDLIEEFGYDACILKAEAAPNAVLAGIDRVSDRLKVQPDGRPRLFIVKDSITEIDPDLRYRKVPYTTEMEVVEYVWSDRSKKEEPVKVNDHGVDMMRYAVAKEDGIGGDVWYPPSSEIVDAEEEIYNPDLENRELVLQRTRHRIFNKRGMQL